MLDYSLAEISEFLGGGVPEIKAVLHRGRVRVRLRELGKNIEAAKPVLDKNKQELLTDYVNRFSTRDFDGVRQMLAEEVRLDLVNKTKMNGSPEVAGNYFHNYRQIKDWHLKLGTVENRCTIIVFDSKENLLRPAYFMLLEWDDGERVTQIRDYRYARHVIRDAEITVV